MSPTFENTTTSTPNSQRANQHQHHSSNKSQHSSTASEESNTLGRQRIHTEPSPRPQPSGWLGPYNEFPSPASSSKSPRGPRQPGSHHSPSIAVERGGPGPGSTLSVGGGFDRIIDSHKALGRWSNDGSGMLDPSTSGGGFKRREFDPKQNETGYPSISLMEPSNSLQSLVESIDDDHVFKLTEMTKKRVEHNNPGQKRQRVVSLPTSEASLANFQPSENTLQSSNSCKAFLESKYSQIYQSINSGYPINRLRKLHEIYPQLHPATLQRNHAHDGKHSAESSLPRSRWLKSSKYRYVDKVEESTCIWDVDHMESKYNEQLQLTEAANVTKISVVPNPRYGSQNSLSRVDSNSTADTKIQPLQSPSTESIATGGLKDASIPPKIITGQSYQDSPSAVADNQNIPIGMSPSSTFSSITSPNNSPLTPESSIQRRQSKDHSGESKLRFVEPNPSKVTIPPAAKIADGNKNSFGSPESSNMDSAASKRHSFLGIFDRRGKKTGHENEQWNNNHLESPHSTSHGSPRLVAIGSAQEYPSEIQHNPHELASNSSMSSQRNHQVSETTLTSEALTKGRTSFEGGAQLPKYNDTAGPLTDDENGAHTASHYAQGERIDESQDESDCPIATADKRSSLRRFKDKMPWKRGNKSLSTIQQGDSTLQASTNTHGKSTEGTKSVGKKFDHTLAYLHEPFTARVATSEPSSGRNSLDYPTRPKSQAFRSLSGTSSPTIDAIRSPDIITGQGFGSPRFGPNSGIPDTVRSDKSPLVHPSKSDKSPLVHPTTRMEKSPMINPRTDKSPMIAPVIGNGEDHLSGVSSHLILDVDRIPKRLLERLKVRSELSSINWTEDTVDLTPILSSSEPMPTYDEYLGISSEMKSLKIYPSYLEDIDVIEIHLALRSDDLMDNNAKTRFQKWDRLEFRLDQEIDNGEKWMKHIEDWTLSKSKSIEKHRQQEISINYAEGGRFFDENMPLVEEPEEEAHETEASHPEGPAVSIIVKSPTNLAKAFEASGPKDALKDFSFNPGLAKSRRQQRELSLLSVRDLSAGGSSMSLHHQNSASVAYTFRSSLESTREAVKEMRVYLTECRERLMQLNVATELLKKEPMFKDIVDLFAREWNDSYFVKLKEVEDQIQVMNLKRIENPWMDMLLIMLSWLIRGLFYLVEGVTIIIIIVRHTWSKTKSGFGTLRNAKREQERLRENRSVEGSGSQMDLSTSM